MHCGRGTGAAYTISGEIFVTSFIVSAYDTTAKTLTSFESGTIIQGATLITAGDAVTVAGVGNTLNVQGALISTGLDAILKTGGSFYLNNSGTIMGYTGAASISSNELVTVVNSGVMQSALSSALVLTSTGSTFGTFSVTNSGDIMGVQGIYLQPYDRNVGIINTGVISGTGDLSGTGIYVFTAGGGTGVVTIQNSGTISGATSILCSGNAFSVTNAGTILGRIDASDFDDYYDGRTGKIAGQINANGGADTLLGGFDSESFNGGSGNDSLSGGGGEDLLVGDVGNDSIRGGSGDDTLEGGSENDVMNGDAGADEVSGGTGNDSVRGGDGDDLLLGGQGVDTLSGHGGDDTLYGDSQRDYLIGGAGADVFDFNAIIDSPRLTDFDIIRDFKQGEDRIDLADLLAGEFVFQGTAAYVGGGTASLRYATVGANATEVYIDADGNGTTEMRIQLTGQHVLLATDFIL